MEADERAVLEGWRDAADFLTADEHARALVARPFQSAISPPAPPDYLGSEIALRANVLEDTRIAARRSGKSKSTELVAGIALALGSGVAGRLLGLQKTGAILLGVAAGLLTFAAVRSLMQQRWDRALQMDADGKADDLWIAERARLEAAHETVTQAHTEQVARARAEWDAAEESRVQWATALVQGDLPTIEEAVFESLDDIDFPFESDCTLAVEGSTHMFINLDAPEIEDVVPDTRYKALKNGTLKEVKRKAEERNADYARLVCGIVLAVAATVFSAAPTVTCVTIAAFTQRKRRSSTAIEDAYVLETRITRDQFATIDAKRVEPVEAVCRFETRIDWSGNLALKKIGIPAWVPDLFAAEDRA